MNLEMMGNVCEILEYNEGARQKCDLKIPEGKLHIWSSSDKQNDDVLGEALNNFQTMTLHRLIDPETVESGKV